MAELRNIRWGEFAKSLLEKDSLSSLRKSRSLQWWLTVGFRKNGYMLLDDLDELVLEYKGVKFYPDLLNYPRMFEAWDRYRIDAVKEGDIVLDLGANVGSYSLPIAKRAKQVYAVEPLFYHGLCSNIALNRLSNVESLKYAIGTEEVDCQEYKGKCEAKSFGELLELLGRQSYDVIRMDIGGEEWNIPPEVALFNEGPRVLEIEFHLPNSKASWNNWKIWLEDEGYGYLARWSKHRHWLYLSAEKGWDVKKEVQLKDGSFRGGSLELWKAQ